MKKQRTFLLALMLLGTLFVVPSQAADIPRDASWKIEATSAYAQKPITGAFDGDAKTYWHSNYTAEGSTVTGHDELPITITVDFGKIMAVSGFRYTARTDNAAGIFKAYNIYASSDGQVFKKIFEGTFNVSTQNPTAEASWGDISMRAIKIEATEGAAGFATAAEIVFLTGTSGTAIQNGAVYEEKSSANAMKVIAPQSTWKIEATSETSGHPIARAFDGDASTYWHTNYVAEGGQITSHDECPHTITVTFPAAESISGLRYLPRQVNGGDNSSAGTFKKADIYASSDGTNFTKLTTATFGDADKDRKAVDVPLTVGSYKAMRIVATETVAGYGTAAEISFLTGAKETEAASSGTQGGAQGGTQGGATVQSAKATHEYVSRSGWTANASSQRQGYPASNMIDGKENTYWHSNYTVEGTSTITARDSVPFYLDFTLPSLTAVSGFTLIPRTELTGVIQGAQIYVSDSLEGDYTLLKDNLTWDRNADLRNIPLTANIRVRRIRVVVTEGAVGYGTLAEFYAWSEDANKETVAFSDYAANEEANRLYKVEGALSATYEGDNWAGNTPDKTVDGIRGSFWQTETIEEFPVTLNVDLGRVYDVCQIDYTPRQTSDLHGCWMKVSVYASEDGETWQEIVKSQALPLSLDTKTLTFPEVSARYFDFEIEQANAKRASAAEIEFYQTKTAYDKVNVEAHEQYVLAIGSKDITWEKGEERGTTTLDVSPYIVNGSTLIPLRGLVEQMGGEILWDGETKTVTIKNEERTIKLQIFNRLVYVSDKKLGDILYTLLNFPVINDSRTFIPVRFVTEQLGYTVLWDGEEKTVTITK